MTFVKRINYGALFEPEDRVLHGAGQDDPAFKAYVDLLGACGKPCLTMSYTGLRGKPENLDKYHSRVSAHLADYPALGLMPQIGLGMTYDGTPEKHYEFEVAQGMYDDNLLRLFDGLGEMGRPFFLRIGYECNGPWNGYPPESYQEAFRHVTDLLRKHGAPGATVWCVEPHEIEEVMRWYPGDDVVDWWSVDWFDADHMVKSSSFLDAAEAHRKPVMIGESSPRRLGTCDAQARWDVWYDPYFETIRNRPGIKAFCYINWDWTRFPMWSDWGDSRLEASAWLVEKWREEMACPLYLHG